MVSGINNTFRQIGIATSVAALGSLFATRLHGADGAQFAATFTSAIDELLLVAAVLALVTGVLALALIRQRDFVTRSERMPAME